MMTCHTLPPATGERRDLLVSPPASSWVPQLCMHKKVVPPIEDTLKGHRHIFRRLRLWRRHANVHVELGVGHRTDQALGYRTAQ